MTICKHQISQNSWEGILENQKVFNFWHGVGMGMQKLYTNVDFFFFLQVKTESIISIICIILRPIRHRYGIFMADMANSDYGLPINRASLHFTSHST